MGEDYMLLNYQVWESTATTREREIFVVEPVDLLGNTDLSVALYATAQCRCVRCRRRPTSGPGALGGAANYMLRNYEGGIRR